MMNTDVMLAMLEEVANQELPSTREILNAAENCARKKDSIRKYSSRYSVANAKGKHDANYFQSITDKAYWTLRKSLAKLLPECKDTDGQIGNSFYLETCPEKGEFVKITISRCNGVQAARKVFTENVADARAYAELDAKQARLEKMAKTFTNLSALANKLSQTIKDLQEFE